MLPMRPKIPVETVERVESVERAELELSSLFERIRFTDADGVCCIRPLKHEMEDMA